MLSLRGIDSHYGRVQVLHALDLEARSGEVTCLMGRNGAGKSTTLKAIIGQVPVRAGRIDFDGADITGLAAHRRPGLGIGYVPQGRRLFSELTVAENLEIGLMAGRGGAVAKAHVLELFPILSERMDQRAGTLSGGEQQQLAMVRALSLRPRLLLLDEPTEGLQPSMIRLIRDTVVKLRAEGVAILLVEQRIDAVLALADHITFIENGRSRETVTPGELRDRPDLIAHYVGVG